MISPAVVSKIDRGARAIRWPWLLLIAVVLVTVLGVASDRFQRDVPKPTLDPATLRPGYGPATFAAALASARRHLEGARVGYDHAPGEWLRGEVLARALIAHWRLAGDYGDLAEADRLLDQGLDQAPQPSGPATSGSFSSGSSPRSSRNRT